MFLEYLNALNTLNTLNVLNSLNIFNKRYPLANIVSDGNIESKSIIAIKLNGYNKNDNTPLLSLMSAVASLNK